MMSRDVTMTSRIQKQFFRTMAADFKPSSIMISYLCPSLKKTGFMSDFISLFPMECSYFHIKNSLKTFLNIVYALIYALHQLIIWSLARTGAQHLHDLHANKPTGVSRRSLTCGQVKEVLCLSPHVRRGAYKRSKVYVVSCDIRRVRYSQKQV